MKKKIYACLVVLVFFITANAQEDTMRMKRDTVIVKPDSLLNQKDSIHIDSSAIKVDSVSAKPDSIKLTDDKPSLIINDINIDPTNEKYRVYKLKPSVDIPVFAVGAAWSMYAFTKIYSKDDSPVETILALNKNDINGFDRGAVRPYDKNLDRISYYPFFGSVPLPFLFLAGQKTRKDFFKLTFLYLEAMSITGFLYTGSTYFVDRYRPYAYSSETEMPQRTRGGAKNSFYAGHVALVATSTFFMAKTYADYHPDSKIKWLFYGLATATTGVTGALRYSGGQHFPSDLLLGITQGALTGILIPHWHKVKKNKDPDLSIYPYGTGRSMGLSFLYRIRP